MSKYRSLKETWTSVAQKFVYTDNFEQNIWNNISGIFLDATRSF